MESSPEDNSELGAVGGGTRNRDLPPTPAPRRRTLPASQSNDDNIPGLVSTERYEIPFNRQLDRLPVPVSSEPRQAYSTDSSLEDAESQNGSMPSFHGLEDFDLKLLLNTRGVDDPRRYDGPQSHGMQRYVLMVVALVNVVEIALTNALRTKRIYNRVTMKLELNKEDKKLFVYRVPSGLKSDLEAINRRELSVSEYNPSILKDYRILELSVQIPENYSLLQVDLQIAGCTYCSMLKDHFSGVFEDSLSERCTLVVETAKTII